MNFEKEKGKKCENFIKHTTLIEKNKPNKIVHKVLNNVAPEINWIEYLPKGKILEEKDEKVEGEVE